MHVSINSFSTPWKKNEYIFHGVEKERQNNKKVNNVLSLLKMWGKFFSIPPVPWAKNDILCLVIIDGFSHLICV